MLLIARAVGLAVISIRSLIYPRGQILDIGVQFFVPLDIREGYREAQGN